MNNKQSEKEQLRKFYRQKRDAITEENVKRWSEAISEHIVSTELYQQAKTVYFYYPLGNEVNLLAVARKALDAGKCVGFPKTEGDIIRFYKVESLEDFQEGCFHVMEPVSTELLDVENPLILTPGLIFDKQKNRMGYGKGYYDRYTAILPKAIKIGVAYEMQLTQEVPVDEYDVPMDYMITEKGMW